MRKYAMIPINTKEDKDGNVLVRRVLISYGFKTHTRINKKSKYSKVVANYHMTKFICADEYFINSKSSHRYSFSDNGYKLELVKNNLNELTYALIPQIYELRKYHGLDRNYEGYPKVIEFKSKTVQEATHEFYARKELR